LKRVILLTLLLVIAGLLFGAEVVTLKSTPLELLAVTKEVVEEELEWRFSSTDYLEVEIKGFTIDQTSFESADAYFIELEFKWDEGRAEQTIAFLAPPDKGWLEPYTARLSKFLRLNFGRQLAPKEGPYISDIVDGGILATGPLNGRRIAVKGANAEVIAIMEADQPKEMTSELIPVWTKSPLAVGMALEKIKRDFPLEVTPRFSGEHYGVSLGVAYPLWVGPFRFTQRLAVDLPYKEGYPIIESYIGLEKIISLGALQKGSAPLGEWWNNIQLGAAFYFGGGIALKEGGVTYTYGTTIEGQLLFQSSLHFYWGFLGGYRYRVVAGEGVGDFLVAPLVGWVW
jgi:hypothetical protein